MAQSALRVRLVFNQKTGGTEANRSRQRLGKEFATTLVERLTFSAAEGEYESIRRNIASSFVKDAKQELTYMAALYRRHIIGAGGTKSRPTGMLGYALGPSDTGVGDDDNEISIAESLPNWAPRTSKYLAEKRRRNWASQWFSARGSLQRLMKADTLIQAFGPIRVTVTRNLKSAPGTLFKAGGNGTARINVATVRVFALTNITPQMLPALRNGDPTAHNGDTGNIGLWQLMRDNVSPAFASSVSGFSGRASGHRYRPTLEPFLAFYLTRSIPNALALRLQQGTLRQKRNRVR